MDQAALILDDPDPAPAERVSVREFCDGQAVDCVLVVRDRSRRQKRNGDPYLKLQLGDATGALEAMIWDGVEEACDQCEPGSVVRVAGHFAIDGKYGPALTVRTIRQARPEEYDLDHLQTGPTVPFDRMVADLRSLLDTVQDSHLRALLDGFFAADSSHWRHFSEAPAAKHYHQAYRHGLLEHCLSVAQGVSAISATFPGIDRDVAVAGALLHDIGKLEAYATVGEAIELTDAGKLQGEIPLGYYMVRREIEELPGFPAHTAEAVLHIILSHHGQLEHGSPVVPCTREATLVHMLDNLGGRLGSFDRIERSLSGDERWSPFDRALSGSAYFPKARAA